MIDKDFSQGIPDLSNLSLHDKTEWEDITKLTRDAALELGVGEMLHCEDFNLHDSMSAFELMDAKMDSGVMEALHFILPVDYRFKKGKGFLIRLLSFELSPVDLLATMDEVFSHEIAWYDGQSLAQTLFTCPYFHTGPIEMCFSQFVGKKMELDRRTTLTLILLVFAICVMKTNDRIRRVVLQADIYEEEDFAPGIFGIDMCYEIPDQQFLEFLEEAQSRLEKLIQQANVKMGNPSKGSSKKKKKKKSNTDSTQITQQQEGTLEPLMEDAKLEIAVCEELLLRLQFRHSYYTAHSLLESPNPQNFETANKLFTIARDQLTSMNVKSDLFGGKPIGFDPKIAHLLSTSAIPRELHRHSNTKAIQCFTLLLDNFITVCSHSSVHTLEDLSRFLSSFSLCKPNITARSYMLCFLYIDEKVLGRFKFNDWLKQSFTMHGVPNVLSSCQEGDQFIRRIIKPIYETLKLYLHNRSRQRYRLDHMLQDWAILQVEATAIDEKFIVEMQIPKMEHTRFLTSWTMEKSFGLLLHYMLLGFELELFSTFEFDGIYWYLDYLIGARIQNLMMASATVAALRSHETIEDKDKESQFPSSQSSGNNKGSKSSKKKKKNKSVSSTSENSSNGGDFSTEILIADSYRALCRGIFQFIAALRLEGRFSNPNFKYGGIDVRFAHRFHQFYNFPYPGSVTYSEFQRISDVSQYKPVVVLNSAAECFKLSKTCAEKILQSSSSGLNHEEQTKLQGLLKTAIANYDHVMQRKQNGEKKKTGAQSTPSKTRKDHPILFQFSFHNQFPVISAE